MTESRKRLVAVQILKKKFPGHYEEIMRMMDLKSIIDTDTENISTYYNRFCRIKGLIDISRLNVKGDRSNTEYRRLFVAAILYIFSPSTFNGVPVLQFGVKSAVASLFKMDRKSVNQMIDQVVFNHKHMAEFCQEVKFTVFRITSGWEENKYCNGSA